MPDLVADIVGVIPPGKGRTAVRFNRNHFHLRAGNLVGKEGKGQSGEVASAAGASDNDVRKLLPGLHELGFGFLTDNGLVKHHMVQNTAQGVLGAP